MKIRRRPSPRAEINVAPLLDCIFLLLVFLLLTCSFSRREDPWPLGLRIALPTAESADDVDRDAVRVVLEESGRILLDDRAVTPEDLEAELRELVREEGPRPLLLVADREARIDTLTEVMDRGRRAGLRSAAIATREAPHAEAPPSERSP